LEFVGVLFRLITWLGPLYTQTALAHIASSSILPCTPEFRTGDGMMCDVAILCLPFSIISPFAKRKTAYNLVSEGNALKIS